MKPAILVVDDEEKILELLRAYLTINGFEVLCAKTGGEGLALFERRLKTAEPVSLVLLDLMLPDFSGETLCGRIRELSGVPLIMITAKAGEEDIIGGLRLGADDYITKPFSPREVIARVQAALRRTPGAAAAGTLAYRDLTVDTETKIARRNGTPVALTRDEFNILALLMSRQAKIFSREEILDAVKGGGYEGFDRAVDTHIKKLRAKIGDDSRTPAYIITVYGMGYRLGEA